MLTINEIKFMAERTIGWEVETYQDIIYIHSEVDVLSQFNLKEARSTKVYVPLLLSQFCDQNNIDIRFNLPYETARFRLPGKPVSFKTYKSADDARIAALKEIMK